MTPQQLSIGPDVRLAASVTKSTGGCVGFRNMEKCIGKETRVGMPLPAMLISYVYMDAWNANKTNYAYRDWMLDSGAYSGYNSGKPIDLDAYIDACRRLKAEDKTLTEIIGLDVIGDARGSVENNFKMLKAGLDIVPVFHIGEDWTILRDYCQAFSKVGLSCRFGEPMAKSLWFYDQCFARAWPKRFHSFGWLTESVMMRFPFHSGDSTSWNIQPSVYGMWKEFGRMSVRGSTHNFRSQIDWYLDLESKLRIRWSREMNQLEQLSHEKTKR